MGYSRGNVLRIVEVKGGRTREFSTPRRSRIGAIAVSRNHRIVFRTGREVLAAGPLRKGRQMAFRSTRQRSRSSGRRTESGSRITTIGSGAGSFRVRARR
jgi:hypothetical protein